MTSSTIGPHLLGRTVEHDPLSRNYPFPVRGIVSPVNRDWPIRSPILDQGNIGSCEGNTGAEWSSWAGAIRSRRAYWTKAGRHTNTYLTETDALRLYSRATHRDDDGEDSVYPPDDTGTSAVGIAKAMQDYGLIDGYTWTFGWAHFLAAIDRGPVMLGTNWYGGMFDPNKAGFVQPAATDRDPDGGHAFLGRAIDYRQQRVRCRNHWTADWGLRGEFYLSFATLQRLLSEQGDVLIPTPK